MLTMDFDGIGLPDTRDLQDIIKRFECERKPRLARLKQYYDGDTPIMRRRRVQGAPNNRISCPYARYLVTMAAGYLAGSPIEYASTRQNETLRRLIASYSAANADNLDAELAVSASLFGVGVELIYLNEDIEPRMTTLDPLRSFVVYDETVAHKPCVGIYHRTARRGVGVGVEVNVFTRDTRARYEGASLDSLVRVWDARHYMGQVPMIEYWNDANERGDIEPVLSLLDAYDLLMSDRLNDKQEFADSLLVLTGVADISSDDGDARSLGRRLREDKALSLPDDGAKVEWLTKQLNETDTQVLADALKAEIHKLAMVPDLSDKSFGGVQSGVAMNYKLHGLEQLVKIKERYFREGLRERLRVLAGMLALTRGEEFDPEEITIKFNRGFSYPINTDDNN